MYWRRQTGQCASTVLVLCCVYPLWLKMRSWLPCNQKLWLAWRFILKRYPRKILKVIGRPWKPRRCAVGGIRSDPVSLCHAWLCACSCLMLCIWIPKTRSSVCFKKFARTSSPWWKAGDPTSGEQLLVTIIVNQSLLVTIIIIIATIVFIIIMDNYHV